MERYSIGSQCKHLKIDAICTDLLLVTTISNPPVKTLCVAAHTCTAETSDICMGVEFALLVQEKRIN